MLNTTEQIRRLVATLALDPGDLEARQALEDLKPRRAQRMLSTYLTHKNGCFVWTGGFETKDIPKRAGFRWHGGDCEYNCPACRAGLGKVWWTGKEALASRIVQFADIPAKKALARHLGTVAASRAVAADVAIPAPEGLRYLPYQQAGINYALRRPGTLLADEMGLGKTIQALGVINADASIRTVLCIAPALVLLNWEREAYKWLVREFTYYVALTSKLPPSEATFVIVNYAKLTGPGSAGLRRVLSSREWDFLILDEAHYLCNARSQRSKSILGYWDKRTRANVEGIFHRAKRQIALTGTPIPNRPVGIQPLLGALAPQEFGHFFRFARRYCDAHEKPIGRGKTVWDFKGSSNLEELQERARGSVMVRRLKSEVLKDLPPKVRQVICLPSTEATDALLARENTAYAQYEEQFLALPANSEETPEDSYLAAAMALQEGVSPIFTEVSNLRRETALAKIPAVLQHVDNALRSVDKIVLFAYHRDVVAQLEQHFSHWSAEEGDEAQNVCVKITGDTPLPKRQEAVDLFQEDPNVRVFIGNIRASGVGISLTAASLAIFAELSWNPSDLTQAEDRLHRLGQLWSVLIQHLVLDGSLDSRMLKLLVRKQEVCDRALDLDTQLDIPCPVAVPESLDDPEPTLPERQPPGMAPDDFSLDACPF